MQIRPSKCCAAAYGSLKLNILREGVGGGPARGPILGPGVANVQSSASTTEPVQPSMRRSVQPTHYNLVGHMPQPATTYTVGSVPTLVSPW